MARPGRNVLLGAAAAAVIAGAVLLVLGDSQPTPRAAASDPAVPRERAVLHVRAGAAAISPDGRRCVTLDQAGSTSLWSCADGERLRRRPGPADGSSPAAIAFTRDGLGIVTSSGDGATVLDPGALQPVLSLRGPSQALAPVISPSASRAFRPRSTHFAEIVDTASGRRLATLPHIPDLVRARVTFSRDDRTVAVITRPRSWVTVFEATSGEPLNSFSLDHARADVDLSADGTRLLIGSGRTLRIMEVITGVERARFEPRSRVTTAAFGVDERLVVAGEADGGVQVWDALTGAEVADYPGGAAAVAGASLAADGRLLVTGLTGPPKVLECAACASG